MSQTHRAWLDTRNRIRGLQPRKEQDEAFSAVLARWDDGVDDVCLQADTGIGKSMIVAPVVQQGPVVYSARTKDQQRQMRDVTGPWLDRNGLLVDGMAVLMGRGNYICLGRAGEAGMKRLTIIGDGTRPNYPERVQRRWDEVCSDRDECRGCGPVEDAYELAREAASTASLLVVNHNLVAIDAYLAGIGVPDDRLPIPRKGGRTLIVDEAQEMGDVLTDAFGGRIGARRLQRIGGATGSMAGLWRNAIKAQDNQYWTDDRLTSLVIEAVGDDMRRLAGEARAGDSKSARTYRSAQRLLGDLELLLEGPDSHVCYASDSERAAVLRKLDIKDENRGMLARYRRSLMMSATMEGLPMRRLGQPTGGLIKVGSPYDMQRRRLAYVTPREARTGPHQWSEEELVALVQASGGGALVLATSHKQKERAAVALSRAGFEVGMQEGSTDLNRTLVQRLKDGAIDVLVGTRGLATGTDIPGPALRLVVLLSWPNPNPSIDPYLRRIGELFKEAGVEPWRDDAWFGALAGIEVHQSVGRLIRGADDFGVVALLEPRWHKRKLARFISPSHTTTSVDDVRNFLGAFL